MKIIDQLVFKPELDQICFGKQCIQLTHTEYLIVQALANAARADDGIPLDQLYELVYRHPLPDGKKPIKSFSAHFTNIRHKMEAKGFTRAIYHVEEKYHFNLNPSIDAPHAIQEFLLHNVVEILGVIDATGKVTYITPTVQDILGYPPEKFIGNSFLDFNHTMHDDDVKHRDVLFQNRPRVARLVYRLQHADGHWFWAEIYVHWLHPDDPNDPTYVFSIRNADAWMTLTGGKIPDFGFQPSD